MAKYTVVAEILKKLNYAVNIGKLVMEEYLEPPSDVY